MSIFFGEARVELERTVRRCFFVIQVRNDVAWSRIVVVDSNEKRSESEYSMKKNST